MLTGSSFLSGPKASQYSKTLHSDPLYTLSIQNDILISLQNKTLHSISLFNMSWWHNVFIHHLWGTFLPGAWDTSLKPSQWVLTKVHREYFLKNTWPASHHWRFSFSESGLKLKNIITETASYHPMVKGKVNIQLQYTELNTIRYVLNMMVAPKEDTQPSWKGGVKGECLSEMQIFLVEV